MSATLSKEACISIPRDVKFLWITSFVCGLFLLVISHPIYAQEKFISGKNYYESSQYDSARACFSSLIDSCKRVCNDSVIALYKIHLGRTLNLQEEYAKALTQFEEAIRLMEKASNENGKAFAMISLAELYRRNGKFEKGTKELDEVFKLIAKGRINKYNEASYYSRYAAIENERGGDTAKIRTYSKKAVDIADKLGYWEIKAGSLNELGYFEENHKQIGAAINYYKQSLEIEQKLNRPIYIASVVCNLARIYLRNAKYSIAEQYARQGIEILMPIRISNTKAYLYKIYSEALLKQNKFRESREALDEHLKYQTKLLKDYYSKSLAELETRFELKKKNKLIDLEREKTVLAWQDADNKKKLIWYIAAGSFLMALLSVLLLLAYKRIRKINVELAGKIYSNKCNTLNLHFTSLLYYLFVSL
jgi:tetratricopeptide (TPR) repeat protein